MHQLLRRIVTALAAVALAFQGLYVVLSIAGFPTPGLDLLSTAAMLSRPLDGPWFVQAVWIAGGVLAVVVALILLRAAVSLDRPRERWHTLWRQVGGDTVRLSHRAAESLVTRVTEAYSGVVQCAPALRLSAEGWEVRALLWVAHDLVVAEETPKISAAVRAALLHHTGHEVREVALRMNFATGPRGPDLQ